MEISEIGTKLTESTLVLHLYNIVARHLTAAWLHDRLGLRIDEQWSALQWPGNERVLLGVYERKRQDWKGKIVRILSDGEVTYLEMPPGSEISEANQIDLLLEGQAVYNETFASWPLPPEDFIVPFSGSLLAEMCGLVKGEAASCVTVKDSKFSYPHDAVNELVSRVDALKQQVAAREARWRNASKSLVAHRRVDSCLHLLARGWHLCVNPGGAEQGAHVDQLRIALGDVREEVVKELVGEEDDAAGAVLEMFADSELVSAVEALAFDPLSIDADDAEELMTAIRFACEALAHSTRAGEFLRDHVWPSVAEACRTPPYAFDRVVAGMKNARLRAELQDGWETTHDAVQSKLGAPTGESLLKTLATAGKYYRGAASVVSSGLGEAMLLQVWGCVDGTAKVRGARLGGLLLRFVVASGVPDPRNASLMFAGRLDLGKVLVYVDTLSTAPTAEALESRLKGLKDLRLKEQFARIPALAGLGLVFSVATLWSVATDDDMEATRRTIAVAAAITGVAESVSHAGVLFKIYQGQTQFYRLTGDIAKFFGWVSVLLGTVSSFLSFRESHKPSDFFMFYGGVLRTSGSALTVLSALLEQEAVQTVVGEVLKGAPYEALLRRTAFRLLGGWLGAAGSVIGLVALVWGVLPPAHLHDQGVEAVLRRYFEEMVASTGAFASREKELRALLAAAPRSALATDLSALIIPATGPDYLVGQPGRWEPGERPTFHAAAMFGFVAPEIAVMFGVPQADVERAEIPATHRGTGPVPQELTK